MEDILPHPTSRTSKAAAEGPQQVKQNHFSGRHFVTPTASGPIWPEVPHNFKKHLNII